MVRIGFVKLGNLGISQVIDLLLDERADRTISTRTVSAGAKMGADEASCVEWLRTWKPDLTVIVSPNASLPGPAKARKSVDGPCIIISDAPAKGAVDTLKKDGFGYIILPGDPLIGARREFLDPTEMALFNSDVLRVLTICGAVRLVQEELDKVINQIQDGKRAGLPQIIADASAVVERAGFSNPYARAKALAAYQMAEKVAEINARACFVLKESQIEKAGDEVSRRPHASSGKILNKRGLLEKPR